jgi:hypothetical protein
MPQNIQLHLKLLSAIAECNTGVIKQLISEGADPFTTLEPTNRSSFNIFIEALRVGDPAVIQVLLDSSLKVVDLSKYPLDDKNRFPCNIFQFACISAGSEVLDVLYKYSVKTKQDIVKIINQKIEILDDNGSTKYEHLASILLKRIGVNIIVDNLCPTDGSPESFHKITTFFKKWASSTTKKPFPNGYTSPMGITWLGALDTFELLIKLGLDLKAVTSDGFTFDNMMSIFNDWSKDPENWEKFIKPAIEFNLLEPTSEAVATAEGTIKFNAILRNAFGAHPIEVEIEIDFRELNDLVQRSVRAQQEVVPQLITFTRDRAISSEAKEKRFVQLETKVDVHDTQIHDFTEQRLKDIRKNLIAYPKVAHVFNHIFATIEDEFNARKIANTSLFTAKSTTDTAMIAKATQAVFAVAMEGVPVPFANVIPAITGGLVNMATQAFADYQSKGVFEATLGLDTKRIAIDMAALITSEMMKRQGSDLDIKDVKKIEKEITKKIGKLHQLQSQAQLVGFVCGPAFEVIRELSGKNSPSNGSGSDSLSSGERNPVVAIQDIEYDHGSSKKSKKKGGGCFPWS